jgi:hypothetical protein
VTGPLSDDPYEGLPATRRRVTREVVGLLLALLGALVLILLLATVDWRLPAGLGALLLIGTGIYLGRGDDEVT